MFQNKALTKTDDEIGIFNKSLSAFRGKGVETKVEVVEPAVVVGVEDGSGFGRGPRVLQGLGRCRSKGVEGGGYGDGFFAVGGVKFGAQRAANVEILAATRDLGEERAGFLGVLFKGVGSRVEKKLDGGKGGVEVHHDKAKLKAAEQAGALAPGAVVGARGRDGGVDRGLEVLTPGGLEKKLKVDGALDFNEDEVVLFCGGDVAVPNFRVDGVAV